MLIKQINLILNLSDNGSNPIGQFMQWILAQKQRDKERNKDTTMQADVIVQALIKHDEIQKKNKHHLFGWLRKN